MSTIDTINDFLTVPASVKYTGIPYTSFYRKIKEGKIITITFGGILFVPRSEADRLKKQLTEAK
jgi:predicted KAP-like P-loop ATPase